MTDNTTIWQDEFGVRYSEDRRILISAPRELKHYTIPDGVARIGIGAFEQCCIESIEIPDSVEAIFECAFRNCERLKEIVLPQNLLYIGYYAFRDCNALTSITIPESTIYVGDGFIDDSNSLRRIRFLGKIERCTIQYRILDGCRELEGIEIPAGTLEHYSTEIFCRGLYNVPLSDYLVESKEGCKALAADAMAKYEALKLEQEKNGEMLEAEEAELMDEDNVKSRCSVDKRKYGYDWDDWDNDFDFEDFEDFEEAEDFLDNAKDVKEHCNYKKEEEDCFDDFYDIDDSMSLADTYFNEDSFYNAYRCYIKSARYNRDAFSMIRIAYCYEMGYDGSINMDEALNWYRRADRVGRIGDTKVEMLFDFAILLRAVREVEARAASGDKEILSRQAHRHFYIIRDVDGVEQSISLSNNKRLLRWFRKFLIRIKISELEEMMR